YGLGASHHSARKWSVPIPRKGSEGSQLMMDSSNITSFSQLASKSAVFHSFLSSIACSITFNSLIRLSKWLEKRLNFFSKDGFFSCISSASVSNSFATMNKTEGLICPPYLRFRILLSFLRPTLLSYVGIHVILKNTILHD